MNIRSLALTGVGPLVDVCLEFVAPGLNVVLGLNESGKSTLCESLSALLYGFPSKRAAAARRSWHPSESFSGMAVLEIEGEQYRIERDFDSDDVLVARMTPDGDQLLFEGNANPRGRTEEPMAYQRLLADELRLPSESVFRNSAYVGQLAVAVQLDEELRRQISGAGQGDYKRAGDTLRETYYALTSQPLPGDRTRSRDRRLERLEGEIGSLRSELDESSGVAREVSQLATELDERRAERREYRQRAGSLSAEVGALDEYLGLLAIRERIAQQERAEQRHKESVNRISQRIATLESDLEREQFARLRSLEGEDLDQLRRYLHSDAASTRSEIAALRAREEELAHALAEKRFRAFKAAPEDTGDLLRQMQQGQSTLEGLQAAAGRTAGRLQAPSGPTGRTALVALGAGALAGAVLGLVVALVLGASTLVVLLSALGSAILLALLSGLLGMSIALHKSQAGQRLEAEQIRLSTRIGDAQRALGALRARLQPVLSAAGDGVTLDVLLERWETRTHMQSELRGVAQRRQLLEERGVLSIGEHPRLKPLLDSLGPQVLQERLAEFGRLRSDLSTARASWRELAEAQGTSRDGLDRVSAELKETVVRIKAIEERYPTFGAFADDREAGLQRLERRRGELNDLNDRAGELDGLISRAELQLARLRGRTCREPASIQDEIDEKELELGRLRLRCGALATAVTTLEEAIAEYEESHLSRLSTVASDHFARFTGGRHPGVEVGAGRELRIRRAGAKPFDSRHLSTGATDQLYLALRLAVLDLLASDVTLPILLDDSFVNFDERRLQIAESVVQEIAASRQVILLTHDSRCKAWADHPIELPAFPDAVLG